MTSVDVGYRKPRTESYIRLANELGTDPSRMMFVGNELKDITGANQSKMKSVLINRSGAERNWNQQVTISDLNEIVSLLK
ncbi:MULTISPECIES: HAD family hydrolase [unclassified Paenibacillus]|uniref:HAD family hydrolase n=1 Tax=unclassified Paenibacillus TaxID=185978 RepID=UPI00364281AE